MSKRLFFLFLIVCMSAVGPAFAQLTPTARINGRVVDQQGSPLPGVNIEATSPRLIGRATAVTDANGVYRLMALPSGTYEITYALPGFKTLVRQGIMIELSQTITVDVALDMAAVEEQITVTGQSPLIDVRSTVKGAVMTRATYLSLPRGRSFDSLISTIPGVQAESNTAGLSVDGATGPENMFYADGADISDFHYGGSPQSIVLELLDEVKVTASGYSAEFGGSMGGVVNVITRSGGNEFHGDILGFYENHSQLMRGKARDFLRRDYEAAGYAYEYVNYDDLYFNGGKDRDRYNRYEAVLSLGGYIIKDRLWFFGSFNPRLSQTSASRDFSDREGPFATFTEKNKGLGGSIRLTAAPIAGLRISAGFINSFTNYRGTIPTILGNGNESYEWAKEGYDYPNMSASLSADYSLGNNMLISYRGGWHEEDTTNQQIAPPDATTYYFGTTNKTYAGDPFYMANPGLIENSGWTSSTLFMETLYYLRGKISNNLDVSLYANWAGEHALKAGVGYNYLYDDRFYGSPHPRVYIYWGQTDNRLGFNVGPKADPADPYYGAYGYYHIRGSFTSDYGSVWETQSSNLSLFAQDSWTIGRKLTINMGIRAESQYMPSFTDQTDVTGYSAKPIEFGLDQTLAPRLGVIYDVFGDSSLKVFGSYGIYYDVMKMYLGQLTFGGSKRVEDIYALKDPDFRKIAASGELDDAASQQAGNKYAGSDYFLPPSFDRVDPDLKPTSQREISFGLEKKLMENLSLSVRLVNKHLIRVIEDIGVAREEVNPDGSIRVYQDFWIANPGFGVSRPVSQGGLFSDEFWTTPKATREYYGLNVSLEKRFSDNWHGGVNYTLSRVFGNFSGLGSSDEGGRLGPGVEQDFDRWFMGYDAQGNVLDGPLPHDRTHFLKAYGSYVFPFGLTVGVIAYGRSGFPVTTKVLYWGKYFYPEGRGDLGRLPFTMWADLFLEYTLRVGERARASVNLQINNVTNTSTIQSKIMTANVTTFTGFNDQILDGSFATNYKSYIAAQGRTHTGFNQWDTRMGPWSGRLGFKFSF